MHRHQGSQRPRPPLQPRRALIVLGALGFGVVLGRIVDLVDYTQPIVYGVASWLSAGGLIRVETEADPVG